MKNNKVKIYINGRFLTQPITGVQRYAHELLISIDNLINNESESVSNFEFLLIAPKQKILHNLQLKCIQICNAGFSSGHLWEQFELPFLIKKGILFCPGNTVPLLSLFSKTPVIITIHSLAYRYFPKAYTFTFKLFYNLLMPLISSFANAIITVSNTEKHNIVKTYPPSKRKISVIQNGGFDHNTLDKLNFKKSINNVSYEMQLLSIASINPLKNQKNIIRAFEILSAKINATLIIVGSNLKIFKSVGLDIPSSLINKIEFKGQINNRDELIQLYNSSDCLIFPSFYEASPLPPIEAMACGCPVIVSNIPSLKERCGNAAYYCEPADPEDIANKIINVITDKKLKINLQEKGLERAKIFTWERCAMNTIKVFKCLQRTS